MSLVAWITPLGAVLFCFFLLLTILWVTKKPAPSKFSPKNVVIIGGSSGLGLELAKVYNQKYPEAKITLISRSMKKLETAKSQMQNQANINLVSLDICQNQENSHHDIVQKLRTSVDGTPDVLVCSAGAAISGSFESIPIEKFQQQMDLHYFSCVLPGLAFVPAMKEQGFGRICFVSSVGGQLGVWGFSAYSSSKFAVVGLAQSLSNELSPYNISVTVSYPPDMDTPGYAEEMKTKPWECHKISETGGLVQAEPVAKQLFCDIQKGHFYSSYNLDAKISTYGSIGWSPNTSVLQCFLQLIFGGVCRFIMICYLRYFDWVSCEGKRKRDNGTYELRENFWRDLNFSQSAT